MKTGLLDIDNWREIGASLARNKTRTFLTAFGIFWGTAMLALLTGGADGFKGVMSRNFAGFSTNMGAVFSEPRSMSYMGFNKGSGWSITTEDVEAIRQVAPAIESSSSITSRGCTGVYSTRSKRGNFIGAEPQYKNIVTPVIYSGRFINESDEKYAKKVVAVGRNIANELFGNEDPTGKRMTLNGISFTVIGTIGQKGEASIAGRLDDSYLVPNSTARKTFNMGNKVDFFPYIAPQGHNPSENEDAIRRVLSRRHAIHPDDKNAIGFMDISEMFEMVDNMFLGIALLALFVGIGSLMAGVIGVGNIMWIIVKERTHEFGIRRAIGARPRDITMQVLSESIVLTLVAGTAGVCFASIILAIADHVTADPLNGMAGFGINFSAAVSIVFIFFILGCAAGTLPAIKAMKIKPIEAINDK